MNIKLEIGDYIVFMYDNEIREGIVEEIHSEAKIIVRNMFGEFEIKESDIIKTNWGLYE